MSLELEFEDLIERWGSDVDVSCAIKEDYKVYLSTLDATFASNSGKDFLVKNTKKIDSIIINIYKYVMRISFKEYMPLTNTIPISLIALGSYGREQLAVGSDIDLMIVYRNVDGYALKPMMEKIIQIAWDSGLKLGSRVHEVGELFDVSNTDITIKTALLESRLIVGSKSLWHESEKELEKIRKFAQDEYIAKKIEELNLRHAKYPISMTFNIKESQGGLRDTNTIYWLLNIKYGATKIKDMIGVVFSDEEYKSYRIAMEYLFRVRNAIHLSSSKKTDTLQLEYLPQVAELMGEKPKHSNSKEMVLATKIISYQVEIYTLTMIFINRILGKLAITIKSFREVLDSEQTCIDFALVDALKNFDIAKRDKDLAKYFKSIFSKENSQYLLYTLYYAQITEKIIPAFLSIKYLAQLDGYHRYPVGMHSIQSVVALENIDDSFVKTIFDGFSPSQKFLIKLIALLHDVGKGRHKDHCIVGETIFKVVGRRLELDEANINLGAKIIKYHTLMSKTINTEDIYNEKTIFNFTSKLGDEHSIKILFVLTYADIVAVDKKIYNGHRRFLLSELYLASIEALENTDMLKSSSARTRRLEALKNQKGFIQLDRASQKKIESIQSDLFFAKLKKDEILRICTIAFGVEDYLYEIANKDFLSVTIIRKTELNLGFLLGKLSFLNIVNMDIFELFDNNKYFKIEFANSVEYADVEYIQNIIANSFDMNKSLNLARPKITEKEIVINCEHSHSLASLSLKTTDQKGLFAYIAKLFDDYKISIETAKLFSKNGKVEDLILIKKNNNFCDLKDKIINLLCE